MQFLEVSQAYVSKLHCPFCGVEVINEEKAPDISPCKHTQFVATSEGFEYFSESFETTCKEFGIDDIDLNVEDVLNNVEDKNVICFISSSMPPAMLELYIGFKSDV